MAQCRNCQFHNLPGVPLCGRCGASLTLATATVAVHPPRATRLQKFTRRLPLFRHWWLLGVLRHHQAHHASWRAAEALPKLIEFVRFLVPGWPQWATGERRLAAILLSGFVVTLGLSLPIYGSWLGYLLLMTACGLHSYGLHQAAARATTRQSTRRVRVLLSILVVTLALYLPVGYGTSFWIEPISIQLTRPPLEAGDVYLVSHFGRSPRPGDAVLYQFPRSDIAVRRVFVIEMVPQTRIDRILAGPGDQVDWTGAQLIVNGEPCNFMPLKPEFRPGPLALTIPEGCYLIVPSTEVGPLVPPANLEGNFWPLICVIPECRILGRVVWRSAPLTRVGVPY